MGAKELEPPTAIRLQGDPLNRYWVHLDASNPTCVNAFRPSLVTFLAFDRSRSINSSHARDTASDEPQEPNTMVGTGFVIAVCGDGGLILTANHVLVGIRNIQNPRAPRDAKPECNPNRLKILWMGDRSAATMNAAWTSHVDGTDIGCCIAIPQAVAPQPFEPSYIPIDTRVPKLGDIVHTVSVTDRMAEELVEPTTSDGVGQSIVLHTRVSIRRGTVTGVYLDGYGQFKWPCFTTTIPAAGGMSGGLVYIPRDKETVGACGIVSADLEAHRLPDENVCGQSVIACTYPALGLTVPAETLGPDGPTHSLWEAINLGLLQMPLGGVDDLEFEKLADGDTRVTRRTVR